MDVLFRIVWGVVLYDPVYLRNVQASGCHVSTQKNALEGLNCDRRVTLRQRKLRGVILADVCLVQQLDCIVQHNSIYLIRSSLDS